VRQGGHGGTATPTTAIQTVISGVLGVYGKPVIAVPLEMRVDSKHRNVGFLALTGRCTVTSLTTAHSQKEKFWFVKWHHYFGI